MIQPRDDELRTLENTGDDDTFELDEAAQVLRVSVSTFRRRCINTGLLKPFYIGRTPYFTRAALVQFIRDRERERRFAAVPVPPPKYRRK